MDDPLDAAPCGLLTFVDDGTITRANSALAGIVGYERETLRGLNLAKLLSVGSRIFYQTHLFPLLKLHGVVEELYLTLRTQGGADVPVLVNAARREQQGQVVYECAVFQIHKRGQFEDELLHAKKAAEDATRDRDEFLAVVSHELRSPLGAILGWVNVLRAKMNDPAVVERAVETIERNAKTQSRLIEDLVDASRIVGGNFRLEVGMIDPAAVIRSAVDVVRPAAEAKSIRLEATFDPAAGPVSGDPDRLQQVMWNLLSNAVKFTPKAGAVSVRLRRVNSHVEIEVADSGEGIGPEFLPYVFERYRQAEGASARRQGGLGLGMAITKEIIGLHGGAIRVRSDGLGKGTTFVVELPVPPLLNSAARDTVPTRDQQTAHLPGLNGVHVLIVDDMPDGRDALTATLIAAGAVVTTAASAAEGFDRLRECRPAVLVSDVEMPAESGLSLLRRVRTLSPEAGGATPAVALTANGRFADRMAALAAGFQVHITKPADPEELVAVIANLSLRVAGSP